jgi:copper(I)-binding protein
MRVHYTTVALALLVLAGAAYGQEKAVTATGAWVAEPAPGASLASAYAVIENPTMYEIFVVKVESDAAQSAGIVESAAPVAELSVPSFGSTTLEPGKLHIELKDLKKALKEGDRVMLTLTTDQGTAIKVEAPVRKPK